MQNENSNTHSNQIQVMQKLTINMDGSLEIWGGMQKRGRRWDGHNSLTRFR